MKQILSLSLILFSITAFAVPVTWTNLANVNVSGNSLTGLTTNSWSAGAFSVEFIGANTDGYFEMTAQGTNFYRMAGLSSVDTNAHYNTIQYAVYLSMNAGLHVYENGTDKGNFGTYASGDVFRVSREGSTMKYYKNGTLFHYTSFIPITSILYADTSLYSYGATIYNAHIVQLPEPASLFLFLCALAVAGRFFIRK